MAARTTQATSVNATSSRSHALITLRVGVEGFPEGTGPEHPLQGRSQPRASHAQARLARAINVPSRFTLYTNLYTQIILWMGGRQELRTA